MQRPRKLSYLSTGGNPARDTTVVLRLLDPINLSHIVSAHFDNFLLPTAIWGDILTRMPALQLLSIFEKDDGLLAALRDNAFCPLLDTLHLVASEFRVEAGAQTEEVLVMRLPKILEARKARGMAIRTITIIAPMELTQVDIDAMLKSELVQEVMVKWEDQNGSMESHRPGSVSVSTETDHADFGQPYDLPGIMDVSDGSELSLLIETDSDEF